VFLADTNRLLSTGFGKQFERQIAIWNAVGIFSTKILSKY
jgi:hypothetical protein